MIAQVDPVTSGNALRDQVIAAMRAEMQEFGELLQLFDEQQAAILKRDAEGALALDTQITAQLQKTRASRRTREQLTESLTGAGATLGEMLPCFPEPMRLLVEALVAELNQLIARARRRAQQNRMLLARSLEVTQELLQKLNPESVTRTYSARGRMKIGAAAVAPRLLNHG